MTKLSEHLYRLNFYMNSAPKEFEDSSQYSAYLGNMAVGQEKRIAELEQENKRLKDAIDMIIGYAEDSIELQQSLALPGTAIKVTKEILVIANKALEGNHIDE